MKEVPDRHCLTCGKVINFGRSDRVYCDDICRARATRKRLKESAAAGYEDRHQAVIRAIRKNYALLKKAIGDREKWIVDFEKLYWQGFKRTFYTGSKVLENGRTRYYCFELGWEELDEARFAVTADPAQLEIFDPKEGDFGFKNQPDED
ncbi:DUF2116 family Zn-ribbon domain-containing protein [Mucilaginibacter sp. RCC_168]|uniref:DUF2116 family Zn-ribbon domain-containing protein n=1 Tax=Mucilaginibacter sp. RCC_168 TaxID=3239221 RepID=UPI00352376C5